jgi:predicted RNA binding protein YcfA (HicA-like mRNA interferase family)
MEFPFPHKSWAKDEWDQIKNLSKKEIISLLNKDGRWQFVGVKGALHIFRNNQYSPPYNYLTIHYHTGGFNNPSLLRQILNHWCCTPDDLRRWKTIKHK